MAHTEIPQAENPNSIKDVFERYYKIVEILRKQCPWDKEQTHESLAPLIIEETYELVQGIHNSDTNDIKKELGDVLLHIVMHSIIASETQKFNIIDVLNGNAEKMINRHPHIFGDVEVSGEEEVTKNWEQIKMKEGQKSVLSGVPTAMPALLRADRIQHKASRIGFDWDNIDDVWNKVYEEFNEFKEEVKSKNQNRIEEEFGDLLFALVNLGRYLNIEPEAALMRTNDKFTRRFQYIENKANDLGKKLNDMPLQEMDAIWDEAKSKGL